MFPLLSNMFRQADLWSTEQDPYPNLYSFLLINIHGTSWENENEPKGLDTVPSILQPDDAGKV